MTMQKFKTQNGMTLGGDLVDEETGEIININNDDFIVNGKHIQAGLGTWLREDSQGDKLYGFDVTTDGQLDFYIEGAVEASLTATALSVSGSNVLVASNIGSTVQGYDAGLAYLDGLNFTNESTFKAGVNLEIGTDVQAYDAGLNAIAGLAVTDGNIIVGNGSTWIAESGATARTSLGLGTGNSPTFTNVTASGHFEGPAEHSSTTSGTLAAGDMNTTISATGGITINNSIGSQGDIVIIYNNTAGNITLTQGTGVTLRLAGSTSAGNRTVATRGLACVYYHAANDVIVGGTGVT